MQKRIHELNTSRFLYNDHETGRSVLEAMEEELLHCEEFQISVAFITEGGMRLLKPAFKELEKRMVRGRILTTDYQNISEPRALLELDQFRNIELRIFGARENKTGFHTKGYLFRRKGIYRIIIGSSNMTSPALTKNKEWNIRFISTEQGEVLQNIQREYEKMWDSSMSLQEWLDHHPAKKSIDKR